MANPENLVAFTPATAHVAGKESARRRPRAHLRNLLDMQDILYADACNPELTPKDRAISACAWEKLENRKRILLGKPDPGSLKPEAPRKAKARVSVTPIEPQ